MRLTPLNLNALSERSGDPAEPGVLNFLQSHQEDALWGNLQFFIFGMSLHLTGLIFCNKRLRHGWLILLLGLFGVGFAGPAISQTGNGMAHQGVEQLLPEQTDAEYPTYLYFADKTNGYLISEERNIRDGQNPRDFCRRIMTELINGPTSGLTRTIPEGAGVRAIYLTPDRTAYVDLTTEIAGNHPGGIRTEQMTVYSIVNTLILNVSAVERVKLLIDGQEADTLAGHIDIRFPLKADMLLVR